MSQSTTIGSVSATAAPAASAPAPALTPEQLSEIAFERTKVALNRLLTLGHGTKDYPRNMVVADGVRVFATYANKEYRGTFQYKVLTDGSGLTDSITLNMDDAIAAVMGIRKIGKIVEVTA